MVAPPGPGADDSKRGFDAAYEELIESERIQTRMDSIEIAETPEWLETLGRILQWLGEWLGPLFSWVPGAGGVARPIIIIVVLVLAAILVFALGRYLFGYFRRSRGKGSGEEESDWRPTSEEAQSVLGDAETLAREGRYAEAAHMLLYRSLDELDKRRPDFLRPALTSRDISRAQALPEAARAAFGRIAQIVERGIFAERPVDRSGWDEARSAYENFAFGESWT